MTDPALPDDHSQMWSRRIVARASWTVLDQGLLALANFAGNVILARWLMPVEYGGYMASSALFWLILTAYNGLMSDPMMVFGSGRFRDRLPSYFSILIVFHWCASAIISAGLAATGLLFILGGATALGWSFVGYALAAPAVLLLLLVRRAVYLWSYPRLAAVAAGVYMIGMVSIMYFLYGTAMLSSFTAPLAAAGAGILGTFMLIAARPFQMWSSWPRDFMHRVAVDHWHYGRWAVTSGMVSWAPAGAYYLLIMPLLTGLEGNGALNALWNLVMPAIQVCVALSLLLIPAFSRRRQDRRSVALIRITMPVMVAGASLYAVVIGLTGAEIINLVYSGRYTQYSHLAWLVGVAAVPNAAIAVSDSALRAYERPDLVLWANVISTIATCVAGAAAVAAWGVLGGVLGLLARDVTTMFVELWLVHRTVGSH
jgi:O-antigen/teichoic acid export membrane protein